MTQLNSINVKYWELAHTRDQLGKKTNLSYSCKCDICGDSKKNNKIKRLSLYTRPQWEADTVGCFNCGAQMTMRQYLKEYHPHLYANYIDEISGKAIDDLSIIFSNNKVSEESKLILNTFEDMISLKTFSLSGDIENCNDNDECLNYLSKRNISPENQNWYFSSDEIIVNDIKLKLKNYIIIPLENNYGEIYGFYSRCITEKKFYTYLPNENYGYKCWNWFSIDKSKTVYICEGIFDALSLSSTNVVSMLGSDINPDRLAELKKPVFIFDNFYRDKTGLDKAKKMAELGYDIFIWPDSIKPKSNIKDINDIRRLGASQDVIQKFIDKNIYSGIEAMVKLSLI